MEMSLSFLFLVLGVFSVSYLVQSQDQSGFISLDCGLTPTDATYIEKTTNLSYISDAKYINTGVGGRIKTQYQSLFQQQAWFVRSFPQGVRNCYSLNLKKGKKYLIRGTFIYGNYDNLDILPSFDLYLGPNLWTSVNILGTINASIVEITHVLTSDKLQICLVKKGNTVPFISSLEIRPLPNQTYVTQAGSLLTFARVYASSNLDGFIRFDEDVYDRIWTSYSDAEWTPISTSSSIQIPDSNIFKPPQLAMKTAATPTNASQPIHITIDGSDIASQYYVYMHFAEVDVLKANETREFNITYNDQHWYGPMIPAYLTADAVYSTMAMGSSDGKLNFLLQKTERSTLPPLINAMEIYTVIDLLQLETDQNDIDAITNITGLYEVNRISWQGDPCAPQAYAWDGLNCSYNADDPPRITSLNLSSSGLTGKITPFISDLTQLQHLDLSNNNLTGEVPEFLAQLKYLKDLNLSGNQLNGSVPADLLTRQKQGLLNLSYGNNPDLCGSNSCSNNSTKNKKKILVPIVAAVASFILVLAALAIFFAIKKRQNTAPQVLQSLPTPRSVIKPSEPSNPSSLELKGRRFSYSEVLTITNNFGEVVGKGGYGMVYLGYLDGTQVAVKILSESSRQGYKQFKAEVELLLRVHHRNLVSLVGYCDEKDKLALIYEYMANGDLKEHLSGKRGSSTLSWEGRLRIATEAAQGLEYLHSGCKPPIVHRDVKTANILLNEDFQAKLGDFGLSKSFAAEGQTHVSTVIAGTPGYLDPEYYRTNWLTEKSDVFSFGVVLLEILTNLRVIDKTRERPHITEWVRLVLDKGDIKSIIDPNLQGDFDTNYVWKVAEVAIACVNPLSHRRPTMGYVVGELSECLMAETARKHGTSQTQSKSSMELSLSFGTEQGPGPR